MVSDAELTATAPRRGGAMVLDPDDLRRRTRDDFQTMLEWLGVTRAVQLNIHARLPGDARPDRRGELPSVPRDVATPSGDTGTEAEGAGRSDVHALSDAELDEVRSLGEAERSGDAPPLDDTELDEVRRSPERPIGGPVGLRRKAADPRHRRSDVVRAGLYTREVAGLDRVTRSVYLNVGLWTVRSAVYATLAHECAHLFLDERGAQRFRGVTSTVNSRLGADEERRTDTVATLLGFGVLLLNGAVEFQERTGTDLLHSEIDVIAHDHMAYCDWAGLSFADATRGMTDRAVAIVRELD